MVTIKQVCIFEEHERLKSQGDDSIIVHCCNAQGVMGSGIAKEIKKHYNNAFQEYKKSGHKLGTCSFTEDICNMVAQEKYGRHGVRYVNYGALSSCLCDLDFVLWCRDQYPTILIPYNMCCDRAGGDWEIVQELISWYLQEYDVVICRKD